MKIYLLADERDYRDITNNIYLGEIDKDIDISDILHFKNEYYVVGLIPKDDDICAVQRINYTPNRTLTNSYDGVQCPICGYKDPDSWEIDDETPNYICPCCGSELDVSRECTITYSAHVIKPSKLVGEITK